MQTKLTLRLDEELIRKAKRYARARGKSVSQLVADHFRALTGTKEARLDEEELPPVTRSLLGAFVGERDVPADPEEAYRKHLEDKHR
ncbi:DUF6364 family protein [Rhodocaloribacter sp.]